MFSRSRWARGLRPVSAATGLLAGLVCGFENRRGHHPFLMRVVLCRQRFLRLADTPSYRVFVCVCVCVCVCGVMCNSNFLHLQ